MSDPKIGGSLILRKCRVDMIDINGAEIDGQLNLTGSHVAGIG